MQPPSPTFQQAAPQAANVPPSAARPLSVSRVPQGNSASQVKASLPHASPFGELTIFPGPLTERLTVVGSPTNSARTATDVLSEMTHVGTAPTQPFDHPSNSKCTCPDA